MDTNVFYILPLKREERHNDFMVEWLCKPNEGHGIPSFAASIVRSLWDLDFGESIAEVKRQCALSPQCVPDLFIQFQESLLLIENKVNAGAMRPGQIELQHRLAQGRQSGRPLYHVLLCPDRLPVDGFVIESGSFKVMRY